MAKDVRALREEAAAATAAGKYKRALAAYLELERMEPRDAQWAKRAGETYRRLGNNKNAIEAFERSADRYAQNGFLVQAIAVCKLILQIDPQHQDTLRRLAGMNEQVSTGPTRAAGMAEHNTSLHENPNVAMLRRSGSSTSIPMQTDAPPMREPEPPPPRERTKPTTPPPVIAVPRTGSKPISLSPGAALETVSLRDEVPHARMRDETKPGIHVIPIEPSRDSVVEELPAPPPSYRPPTTGPIGRQATDAAAAPLPSAVRGTMQMPSLSRFPAAAGPGTAVHEERQSGPPVYNIDAPDDELDIETEIEMARGTDRPSAPSLEVEVDATTEDVEAEVDDATELDLEDIEEVPLAEPRAIGVAARRALSMTPLFAGLSGQLLEVLVSQLSIVSLEPGQQLFREGDPGDALYVVVEGELAVQSEGPPRVEMSRLGPGSFIGEVALLTDQPRSATVTAIENAELLRIDRMTLSHVLGSHGEMLNAVLRFARDRLVERWMRTSPLFRPFDEQQRNELASRFTFLEIEADTLLIGAGKRPDGLYIVLAGQFSVQRGGATVATLGPGDLIGETALLSGGAFRSDVSARGKSLALCLPASDFREIIMTHPHVLEYIGEQAEHSRSLQIL